MKPSIVTTFSNEVNSDVFIFFAIIVVDLDPPHHREVRQKQQQKSKMSCKQRRSESYQYNEINVDCLDSS